MFKKLTNRLLLFCLILSGAVGNRMAMAQQYDFRYWSVAEGLPKSGVYTVIQDSRGYLWAGTEGGGAAQFDGREFKTFRSQEGLTGKFIRAISEDENGALWFGSSDAGLSSFDGLVWKNFPSSHESLDIHALAVQNTSPLPAQPANDAQNASSRIWVGTQNHGLQCLENGQWVLPEGIEEIRDVPVSALLLDQQNRLWIGTDQGLALYDQNRLQRFGLSEGFLPRAVHCLYQSQNGEIWFGTEKGVLRYDGESFYLLNSVDGLIDSRVIAIGQDKQGAMWFGTPMGVSRYDAAGFGSFNARNGLSFDRIRSIVCDREGNIWMGTYFGGMARFRDEAFVHYTEKDGLPSLVIPDLDSRGGLLAAATWNGLALLRGNQPSRLDTLDGLLAQGIQLVSVDPEGRVWVGYDEPGLSLVEGERILHIALPVEWADQPVQQLCSPDAGGVWAVDASGSLFRVNRSGESALPPFKIKVPGSVSCLSADSSGQLWLGTQTGAVLKIQKGSNGAIPYEVASLPALPWTSPITAMCIRSGKELWVGSSDGRIARWDGSTWRTFPILTGSLNQDVGNLLIDGNGVLWVSLDRGLLRVTLDDKGLPLYTRSYNELQGFLGAAAMPGAACVDSAGRVWFGTSKGLSCFRPALETTNQTVPIVHLSSVRLFSRLNEWGDFSDTLQPWTGLPVKLDLPSSDNHLTFQFTGIVLTSPESVRYRWKMEGFETEWVEGGARSFATYSNLPPGTYRFVVSAGDDKGNWSDTNATFSFHVNKPFWSSIWFIVFCIATAVALFVGMVRLRTAAIARSHAELDEKVKAQTVQIQQQNAQLSEALIEAQSARESAEHSEKAKEQFLANMSHEIRTPMNAVVGLTRLLLEKNPAEHQVGFLQAIRQSADNLLVIINDILDFSKIEAGKMAFESAPFDLDQVLLGLDHMLGFKAKEKSIELWVGRANEVPQWLVGDSARLTQILINLTGNAIKFTAEGCVEISVLVLERKDEKVVLQFRVRDTGIGIPPERQNDIFESFTQAADNTTRLYGGTGLGLAISKQLVELQQGQIGVESELGKGSTFFFSVPFGIVDAPPLKDSLGDSPSKIQQLMEQSNSGSALHLLLLEDNPFNQMVAEETLKSRIPHVEVHIAENGKVGLALLEREPIDLVLMDLGMPEMDGFETTACIRSHTDPTIRSLPIIAMTASVTQSEIDRCFEAGMNEYVPKPFDADDLILKIGQLMDAREIAKKEIKHN